MMNGKPFSPIRNGLKNFGFYRILVTPLTNYPKTILPPLTIATANLNNELLTTTSTAFLTDFQIRLSFSDLVILLQCILPHFV